MIKLVIKVQYTKCRQGAAWIHAGGHCRGQEKLSRRGKGECKKT